MSNWRQHCLLADWEVKKLLLRMNEADVKRCAAMVPTGLWVRGVRMFSPE